jgi:heme A synthase
MRFYSAERHLRHDAILMVGLLFLQLTLGALTVWSGRAVLPTTSHVAIGAAVLGASLALTIRAFELRLRNASTRIASDTSTIDAMRAQVSA